MPECLKCGKFFNISRNIVEEIRSRSARGESFAIIVRCPHCGFKYATPIVIETPKKKIEVGCYKAKIEKFADDVYRVYLFQSVEGGGDTEICIYGDVEIWREIIEKDKRGQLTSSGFRKVDF